LCGGFVQFTVRFCLLRCAVASAGNDRNMSRAFPRVLAHRGASDAVAEHTLSAYLRAIDDGADGLECDVRLTADGHLVCVHDRRVERTSSGTGLVSTLELSDLDQLDWVSWKHQWSDLDDEAPDVTDTGVLTLARLLDVVQAAKRPIELAIETKHPTRYAGLVERRLVELLHQYGFTEPADKPVDHRVRVMSFARVSLWRIRELAPAVPTVLLTERMVRRIRTGQLPLGVGALGAHINLVRKDPDLVARFHAGGHEVYVFTVNSPAEVQLCADLRVDAIITDRPKAVRGQLAA
jgi:glycerophosphoryl diester phosphodiesterase